MQEEARLYLIRKYDPNALHLVSKDRSAYYVAKRIIDMVVALILLVLLSPLMILTAISIYLYSPGPILFVQERVGVKRQQYGRCSYWKRVNFCCYKFRTMKINANPSIHKAYIKALIENDQSQMATIRVEVTDTR